MAMDDGGGALLDDPGANGSRYHYPFAAAPDIIRSNQKDAYFQAVLLDQLSSILRNIKGARFVHNYATEGRAVADILYLGLTTFVGNRTLGEEYCDILQVEEDSGRLPSLRHRAGYILTAVLLPYASSRILPLVRRLVRASLESRLALNPKAAPSRFAALQTYVLDNLDSITSPAPLYALSLATFYFSGAYYHLSKRLFGLRYIFTHTASQAEQRAGYEVLGVLLVLQMSVQAYLHLQDTLSTDPRDADVAVGVAGLQIITGTSAILPGEVEVSLDPASYSSNNTLLFSPSPSDPALSTSQRRLAMMTHTEHPMEARFDLQNKEVMKWLNGRQARKCTLCLEPMKDPSATTCGHLFCWTCICDWCREKPECPLCRQACLIQHILPLREG